MQKNLPKALLSLGLGTVLFALGPAILKLLTTKGGTLGLENPGAISFCNVLFVGNFSAGLVVLATYGARSLFEELAGLHRHTKLALMGAAIVSTIYPALLFTALEQTSVINVVLLSRFNGIVLVVLSSMFVGVTVRRSEILGYGIIGMAVIALVVVGNGGRGIRTGDALVLIATVFFALTEFLSRAVLRGCSIEAYVFFRNFTSALIFFGIAVYLFGFGHFAEAFSGELWILMIVYAGLAVVLAQLSWLKATSVLPVQTVANAQLVNPAFSIAFAYLLLGETPTLAEWVVVAVIVAGTLLPKLDTWEYRRRDAMVFGPGFAGTH
jgi:drug/metabolite transporter (DMT)-like permease